MVGAVNAAVLRVEESRRVTPCCSAMNTCPYPPCLRSHRSLTWALAPSPYSPILCVMRGADGAARCMVRQPPWAIRTRARPCHPSGRKYRQTASRRNMQASYHPPYVSFPVRSPDTWIPPPNRSVTCRFGSASIPSSIRQAKQHDPLRAHPT